MNSIEIERYGRKLKNFLGCFASDKLPNRKISNRRASLIVNLCPHRITAESPLSLYCHWVAIVLNKNSITYFDTSGTASYLNNKSLNRFLKKQKKKIIYNRVQIQSEISQECGRFSLLFLYAHEHEISLERYLKIFHKKKLERNDKIIRKIFRDLYE